MIELDIGNGLIFIWHLTNFNLIQHKHLDFDMYYLFFRMGGARRICLPEGLSRVFLLQGEVGCSCWQMQSSPISNLCGCKQRRELVIQYRSKSSECCNMGSLSSSWDYSTNCCGSCQLHGVEGWGFWNLVQGMGSSLPRGWCFQKIASRGWFCFKHVPYS